MADNALAAVTFFRDLDADQLGELAEIAVEVRARAGHPVFSQGEPTRAFYAVASGRIKVFKTLRDARRITVRLVEPGDTFGESALFANTYPSSATVLADAVLLELACGSFRQLLELRPDLSMSLLAMQTRHMLMLNQRIDELLLPVHLRLARLLLDCGPGFTFVRRGVVRLDISKRELAGRVGAAPETLSRAFEQLAKAGVIRVKGRSVFLLNANELDRLVNLAGKPDHDAAVPSGRGSAQRD